MPNPDLADFSAVLDAALDGIIVVDAGGRYRYANPAAGRMLGYPPAVLIGQDLLRNFPPHEHARLLGRLAAGAAGAPEPDTTTILRPDGEEREVSYSTLQVVVDGQPCGAAILRDMTEEHLRLARERGALIQIAASMAVRESLASMLEALAANAVRATDAGAAAVVLSEDAGPARMVASAGLPPGYPAAFDAAVRAGAPVPALEAARAQRTVVLHDAHAFVLSQPSYQPLHDVIRTVPWDIVVSVPLIYRAHVIGVLSSYYPAGANPAEADLTFLTAIAEQGAVAVVNARLRRQAEAKAALEERRRLARDLHDSVSQALFGIALGARTAQTLLDQDPARAAEPLDYVLSLAEAGLAEMHALIFELRPEALAAEGLVAMLERQIVALRARHHLDVAARLPAEPDIPLPVKEALYRIAQEALQNVVKHARATRAAVELESAPGAVRLEVRDNGDGFDPTGAFPGHLGLQSMRERAARLGGTMAFTSAPGAGTCVRATFPV